jgi:hypothetical protein
MTLQTPLRQLNDGAHPGASGRVSNKLKQAAGELSIARICHSHLSARAIERRRKAPPWRASAEPSAPSRAAGRDGLALVRLADKSCCKAVRYRARVAIAKLPLPIKNGPPSAPPRRYPGVAA